MLTPYDFLDFAERGYAIVPGVVPPDLCKAVVKDIELHIGADNQELYVSPAGMVEMYHYQSMWDVRQHPAVLEAFSQIWGTRSLWISIDRTCRKPPDSPESPFPGFIHWDVNINQRPRPQVYQGLVALTDTTKEMGGFQCVPSLYRELDTWLVDLPTGKSAFGQLEVYKGRAFPYAPKGWGSYMVDAFELGGWEIVKVPMKAGDLLIWDSFLPHGNGSNRSKETRYAQYVTMTKPGDERTAFERFACWKNNAPPSDYAFPGDPRKIEQNRGEPARLTALGRGLLYENL